MSLSLIGIIFVQAYYINDSVKNADERFNHKVKTAISYVSNKIADDELDQYYNRYLSLDKEKQSDTAAVTQLLIYQQNRNTKETIIFKSGVLEENYKLSSTLFDIGLDIDSINIQNIISDSKIEVYNDTDFSEKDISQNPTLSIVNSGNIGEAQKNNFDNALKEARKSIPVHKRISNREIESLLTKRLKEDNIDIDYEFAIYDNDLATKVYSDGFERNIGSNFSVPIFYDENKQSSYKFLVDFPDDKNFILSSIMGMILLSIIFTSVIILAYSSALYQLIKQRKISEIKTDFINNMTHEFKTPIATINLALDAIKNPKIIDDKTKVVRYLNMIKEENKRMHAQVENVLRISKLEKNELDISKDRVELHDLVEDAITHVQLLIEDRNGKIETHFKADKSSVLASEMHLTNVIVNILDNAIKYSPNALKIEVFTEKIGTNILLKIKDYGSGMSKAALKKVFEKFYREHTGNIHNVKGHGLGLAYVKRIIDDHHGHVSVESEKGKGSTFIIKLPLIT